MTFWWTLCSLSWKGPIVVSWIPLSGSRMAHHAMWQMSTFNCWTENLMAELSVGEQSGARSGPPDHQTWTPVIFSCGDTSSKGSYPLKKAVIKGDIVKFTGSSNHSEMDFWHHNMNANALRLAWLGPGQKERNRRKILFQMISQVASIVQKLVQVLKTFDMNVWCH